MFADPPVPLVMIFPLPFKVTVFPEADALMVEELPVSVVELPDPSVSVSAVPSVTEFAEPVSVAELLLPSVRMLLDPVTVFLVPVTTADPVAANVRLLLLPLILKRSAPFS